MVSKALEMRFSFARWSALATAASSLVVEAESSSSESSSSSILTFCPPPPPPPPPLPPRSWWWWWWWWCRSALKAPRSGLSAGDAPRWFIGLLLTPPKASERMPANDVTTLANVLRSAFQPKAILIFDENVKQKNNTRSMMGFFFPFAHRFRQRLIDLFQQQKNVPCKFVLKKKSLSYVWGCLAMKRFVQRLKGRHWPPMRDRRARGNWPMSTTETTETRISCRRLAFAPIAPLDGESQHNWKINERELWRIQIDHLSTHFFLTHFFFFLRLNN